MELTDKQIARQDFVDNYVYNLLTNLIPSNKEMDWDIDAIGRVRDTIEQVLVEKGLCAKQDFYPSIKE